MIKTSKDKVDDLVLKPMVGHLFIDKLVLAINFPEHLHPQIIEKFLNIQKNWAKKHFSKSYTHSLILSDNSIDYEGLIIIQCCPLNPNYKFFRVELNPARADLSNLKTVIDWMIPDGYAGLLLNGIINRIDLSIDISNVKISDLLAEFPRMRIEGHHRMGAAKETKKIGSAASKTQIILYDKRKQLHDLKAKSSFSAMIPAAPAEDRTRIEVRLNKTKKTLKGIGAGENPFEKLSLKTFPSSDPQQQYDPLWSLFLSACQDHGVRNALKHFNAKDRQQYKMRLDKECHADWWNPKAVWLGFQGAVSAITNVPSFSPHIQFTAG